MRGWSIRDRNLQCKAYLIHRSPPSPLYSPSPFTPSQSCAIAWCLLDERSEPDHSNWFILSIWDFGHEGTETPAWIKLLQKRLLGFLTCPKLKWLQRSELGKQYPSAEIRSSALKPMVENGHDNYLWLDCNCDKRNWDLDAELWSPTAFRSTLQSENTWKNFINSLIINGVHETKEVGVLKAFFQVS